MSTKLAKIIANFSTQLTTQISVGGLIATLSSATDRDGVALPSGQYYFTLDGGNASQEHIRCTLSGTSITDIKSVSRQGVETTGVVRLHRVGASVTITDFAHIKVINDLLSGATAFDAASPLGYDAAPTILIGNQWATVAYVLSVVTGGTVTFDQQVAANQTAGETLAINDLVYFKESDQRWWKVTAGITTTVDKIKVGFNKTVAVAGGSITVAISGPVSGFTGLTAGAKYFASATAGGITVTDLGYAEFIGWALSTTQILLVPIVDYVSTSEVSASGTDQSQVVSNATIEFGMADATTQKNLVAQSFITTKAKIRGFTIKKKVDSGTFTGTVTFTLQADTSGAPSGSALATATLTNAQWAAIPTDGTPEILFGTEYDSASPGITYWIVASASTADNSNHPNLAYQNTDVYTNGILRYKNVTDSWVTVTGDLYFTTLEGNISQIPRTNSSGELSGFTKMPVVNVYTVSANSGSDTTRFDITNPSGSTFRYTYDGTGTDPVINATTCPIGTIVQIFSINMNSNNRGTFIVTGSGSNYFEITNASGVAENDKTIATGGYLNFTNYTWTKPANLKYLVIEVQGGGASGGIGTIGGPGGDSLFGTLVRANGGTAGPASAGIGTAGGPGGTATGGDINIQGGNGGMQSLSNAINGPGGAGGRSFFGRTYGQGGKGVDGTSGGQGASAGAGAGGYAKKTIATTSLNYTYKIAVGVKSSFTGDPGTDGVVIVTEYY